MTTKSAKGKPSSKQPVVGEDGYTEYKRSSDHNQDSYEDLQKGSSPDKKGKSSNTCYENSSVEIGNGDSNPQNEFIVTSNKTGDNEDNEYAYAYTDIPQTNTNNVKPSGAYENSSVIRKMP